MSKLDELIEKLCPNGVEYKALKEFGTMIRGSGLQKKDFVDQGVGCIHYGQIYTYYETFTHKTKSFVSSELASKLKKVNTGDLIIAVTSENVEDVCKCVAWLGEDEIVTGGHSAIFKHNQNPKYLSYYFQTAEFFNQKRKIANGTKVIEVSPKKLECVKVPLPPLEVQCEIVRILDNFTELTAELTVELTAELTARKKQYEYYQDNILAFNDVHYYTLEDVCDIVDYRGKTPKKVGSGIFLVTAKNIRKGFIDYDKSQEFISPEDYNTVMRRGIPLIGDVLITTEAPCGNVAQVDRENIALAQRVIKYRPKSNFLNATFLKYVLLGNEFQNKLLSQATGGTVKGIKGSKLHKLTIPVPPIEEQNRIVSILDRFDRMYNDISEGLSAEIEARQKQYEYYRDKLLTFKELK